jgi:uncharacterized membrane protein
MVLFLGRIDGADRDDRGHDSGLQMIGPFPLPHWNETQAMVFFCGPIAIVLALAIHLQTPLPRYQHPRPTSKIKIAVVGVMLALAFVLLVLPR